MKDITGRITLVGAGPGDAGLLTLKGADVIRDAQVILFDRLVGPDILALIPPDAEAIDVGKESGVHPVPQGEINRLMLEKALEGKHVVRLKGGDPYLFGRGAEELEKVARAGIPFEVIPGVSASLAAPAYAGIPVTHRDHSSSVHILTGHARAGSAPDLNYQSLVSLGGTLVFLMGFSAIEEILSGLLEAGMGGDTLAALVQEGTLPTQRKVVATVATLAKRVDEEKLSSPAVLVVGAVCGLSDELDWVSRRPLFGKTALVTRPETADSRLADSLTALGCGVIRFPCIHLVPCAETAVLDKLGEYQWIVFTSAFGVQTFFGLLAQAKRDIRSLAGLRFAAVGSCTAREIENRGIVVDYIPKVYDACHLANGLVRRVRPGEKLLLFRAKAGTQELPELLQRSGLCFTDYPAYQTHHNNPASPRVREKLQQGGIDFVTFTSASTVEGFVQAIGEETIQRSAFSGICIGEQTAKAARVQGIKVITSPQATIDSMVRTILEQKEVTML